MARWLGLAIFCRALCRYNIVLRRSGPGRLVIRLLAGAFSYLTFSCLFAGTEYEHAAAQGTLLAQGAGLQRSLPTNSPCAPILATTGSSSVICHCRLVPLLCLPLWERIGFMKTPVPVARRAAQIARRCSSDQLRNAVSRCRSPPLPPALLGLRFS